MYQPFDLSGRTILVTGASSGIGRCLVTLLARMGASLVLAGRNRTRLEETMASLEGNGHVAYTFDITSPRDIEAFAASVPEIDGLVHSAGILNIVPFRVQGENEMEQVMRTNFHGPSMLLRELLNGKKIRRNGSVVLISSVNGTATHVKGFSAYASSKAALESLCKILALEYASRPIRFNAVAPGMIKTEMLKEMQTTVSADSIAQDKKRYPLGDYGNPEDVAHACIYLLSNASCWVTGTSIVVDGGLTIN